MKWMPKKETRKKEYFILSFFDVQIEMNNNKLREIEAECEKTVYYTYTFTVKAYIIII